MAIYNIPEYNMEALEKKLTRIKNKAEKYGIPFTYKELEIYTDEVTINKINYEIEFHKIDVECEIKRGGWEVVAVIEHHTNANNVYTLSGTTNPAWKIVKSNCDHCGHDRVRNKTVIIRNGQGEYKQIGSTCLQEYTNGISAENPANAFFPKLEISDYAAMMETCIKELEDSSDRYNGFCFDACRFNIVSFVSACVYSIEKDGYISKSTAYKEYGSGTKSTMERALDIYKDSVLSDVISNYDDESKAAIKWIRESVTGETQNEFLWNLHVKCMGDSIDYNSLGFASYLIIAYRKMLGKLKEREEKKNNSRSIYIGEIDEKITISCSLELVKSFDGMYGVSYLYKMVDSFGNVYTWFTSKCIDNSQNVKVTGTVKEHKEFNGEKQTVLTRCRVS